MAKTNNNVLFMLLISFIGRCVFSIVIEQIYVFKSAIWTIIDNSDVVEKHYTMTKLVVELRYKYKDKI